MADKKKSKTAKKSAKAPERKRAAKAVEAPRREAKSGGRRQGKANGAGLDLAKLIEHPLVADLLAVGAMAAVAAIAEHNVKSRTGELGAGSAGAVKSAGKAAAAAIGRRLMTEVKEVRKAGKPSEA